MKTKYGRRIKQIGILALLIALAYVAVDVFVDNSRFQLFGRLICNISTNQKVIALTFDDGPDEMTTRELLEILEASGVKTTFFLIGNRIEKNPEDAKAIVEAGHQVGNHSYSHMPLIYETPAFIREEITKTDDLIREAGYQGRILFRAPFGKKLIVLPYFLMKMDKINVLFDVDPKDYKNGANDTVSYVIGHVKPGSIVLLHENPNVLQATPKIISALKHEGYEFLTVDEMLSLVNDCN